jgi:hypothetical protein
MVEWLVRVILSALGNASLGKQNACSFDVRSTRTSPSPTTWVPSPKREDAVQARSVSLGCPPVDHGLANTAVASYVSAKSQQG